MLNEESIRYSLRNLSHRKGRSFLTVFSILIGIATIFIFVSYGLGLYNYTESFTTSSSADKLLITTKGAGLPGSDSSIVLDNEDLEVIERAAGVYDATGNYMNAVQVEKKNKVIYTYIMSYDPRRPLIMDLLGIGVEEGRDLKSGDNDAVFGYNYMIPGKIFDSALEINDVVEVNGEKIKVIGFMESVGSPPDDASIYITNEKFEDLYPDKKSYAQIIARVDLSDIDGTIENIERGLRKHRDLEKGKEDFYVQSFEDMIESFSGALNVIIAFVILIALVSVIVSAVNTANTMITSVLERYKEIGILKAIGARNSEIFTIFLFESAFLGFVAGVLGVLLGFGLTELASTIITNLGWGFLQPFYNKWLFIGCILFATLTGAISGVIPAIRASKTNTVDALRYE
jgi:putative ABC transport system permease protein